MDTSALRALKRKHLERLDAHHAAHPFDEAGALDLASKYALHKAYLLDEMATKARVQPIRTVNTGKVPRFGKKFAMKAAMHMDDSDTDDDDEDGDKPKRTSRTLSKEEKQAHLEANLKKQIHRMVDLFHNNETAIVTCTREQLLAADARIKVNINAIAKPLDKLRELAQSTFNMPEDSLTMRLPVDHMDNLRKGVLGIDKTCRSCHIALKGQFVQSLKCLRSRFCVPCTMVLIKRVGAELFYECMAKMDHRHKKTGVVTNKPWVCRHGMPWDNPALKKERDDAFAMFTAV